MRITFSVYFPYSPSTYMKLANKNESSSLKKPYSLPWDFRTLAKWRIEKTKKNGIWSETFPNNSQCPRIPQSDIEKGGKSVSLFSFARLSICFRPSFGFFWVCCIFSWSVFSVYFCLHLSKYWAYTYCFAWLSASSIKISELGQLESLDPDPCVHPTPHCLPYANGKTKGDKALLVEIVRIPDTLEVLNIYKFNKIHL